MVNREGNYVCSGNCLFLFMLPARNWIIHITSQKPIHPLPIPANLCGAAVQQPLQGLVMFGCSDGVVLVVHVPCSDMNQRMDGISPNMMDFFGFVWYQWSNPQKTYLTKPESHPPSPRVTALLLKSHTLNLQFKGSTKISNSRKKKHSLPTFLHGFRQCVNDLFVGSHTWAQRRIQL